MRAGAAMPFVVGQWVCGARFYGRHAELAHLGRAAERKLWVIGLRRVGKTSLLRQLEHLAGEWEGRTLPLVWDLQGVDSTRELGLSFEDALLDAGDALAGRGIAPPQGAAGDLLTSAGRLLDDLKRHRIEPLLLCDEADELIGQHEAVQALAGRVLDAVAAVGKVIVASSPRLSDSLAAGEGPPPLTDLATPLYLGPMSEHGARALLGQDLLPAAARPRFDEATVAALREACGDHPMLLQLLGRRCHQTGDAGEALRQVAADRAVGHLFAADHRLLTPAERTILQAVAAGERPAGADAHPDPAAAAAGADIERLLALGLLRGSAAAGLTLPNRLLADWLRRASSAA